MLVHGSHRPGCGYFCEIVKECEFLSGDGTSCNYHCECKTGEPGGLSVRILGDFGLLIQNFRAISTCFNSYLLTQGMTPIPVSSKDVGLF